MLKPGVPAVILAPMEGLTDAPMRAVQGEIGAFTFAVSEFLRISSDVPSKRAFHRHVPELLNGCLTCNGLPVQIQLLGGDPGRMAASAAVACDAGAKAIDINFGCPTKTVNRHDGGATLLKYPKRIREIVATMRSAVPSHIPVSAKLRLGWDNIDSIFENAAMAAEGGAAWITIHARTRDQGYKPPAYWQNIGIVRDRLDIPVVANGDIWSIEDFRRCREETSCIHFMLGRCALANPWLSHQIARELGIASPEPVDEMTEDFNWLPYLHRLAAFSEFFEITSTRLIVGRMKQWLNIAKLRGNCPAFEQVKRAESVEELFRILASAASA